MHFAFFFAFLFIPAVKLDLGFRGHDFGKFPAVEDLVLTAKSFYEGSCIQFAPAKDIENGPKMMDREWAENAYKSFKNNDIRISVLGCYINPIHPDPEKQEPELRRFENPIDNAQRMLKVMEEFKSPSLCVIFDAVNIMPVNGPDNYETFYDEAVSMPAPYIGAMHIKDFVWVDSSPEFPYAKGPVKKGTIPAGEGLMPWEMIFRLYRKYGCDNVPMMFENFNPATLRQSIDYIRNISDKL